MRGYHQQPLPKSNLGAYLYTYIYTSLFGFQILEKCPDSTVLLISESEIVKMAADVTRVTNSLDDFVVVETSVSAFQELHPGAEVIVDRMKYLNSTEWVSCVRFQAPCVISLE